MSTALTALGCRPALVPGGRSGGFPVRQTLRKNVIVRRQPEAETLPPPLPRGVRPQAHPSSPPQAAQSSERKSFKAQQLEMKIFVCVISLLGAAISFWTGWPWSVLGWVQLMLGFLLCLL